ncbi:MAG: hypothetical protein WCS72_19765 [Deltaproteobacteria bacterium]
MNRIRRAGPITLWTVQWSLAIAIFVLGMLDVGLSPENQTRGLVQAMAAVALVVPSASRFFPTLSPLVAAALGFALATRASTPVDLVLAAGCMALAYARGFLAPVEPADLRAEQVDPFARPDGKGAARHVPEPPPYRPGPPGRVHAYLLRFAHL